MKLFDGQTATGQSSSMPWPGGIGVLQVAGTFDGCTVTLQVSLDDGTTWTATDAALTAAGVKNIEVQTPCLVRLDLASAGASTDIDAWLAV